MSRYNPCMHIVLFHSKQALQNEEKFLDMSLPLPEDQVSQVTHVQVPLFVALVYISLCLCLQLLYNCEDAYTYTYVG